MKKNKKNQLPFRINVIFFIIFLLFALIVLQLGVVQILKGEHAQHEINRTEKSITEVPAPRGFMYDRYGRLLVRNEPVYSITYTPPKNVQFEDKLEVAKKLAPFIKKDINNVTEWDKKDYWLVQHRDEAYSRLSAEELQLENKDQYYKVMEKISEEDLSDLTDHDLEVIAILRELNQAPALTPHIIKNQNISETEYATIAEHLSELPGVGVSIDWNRKHIYEDTFTSFLGSTTSYDQGLPHDKLDYYLARHYSRNDRVGISGLEEQYEFVLRGQKKVVQNTTDKKGNLIDSEVIRVGSQGKSLVLTIDIELQQQVDTILKEELERIIKAHPIKNKYVKDALAVMMNPNTGELYAMSGIRYYRKGEDARNPAPHFKDEGFRVLYDAHRPGSSIKGATVLAGYESGVIDIGTIFYDAPMKIKGTPEKSSYQTLGNVNDITALSKSSNVYMYYIALRMGGEYNYVRNKEVSFNPDSFRQMRNYFKQFGLGTETGIDLPFESTGYKGNVAQPGLLMDYAIGQYDTFTTLQLVQYVSTIANDGYRIRPHLVKEIRHSITEGEPSSIHKIIKPEVINKIDMGQAHINRVKEGFRRVFQHRDGTADHIFRNKPYKPAGKTGTAENEIYEERNGKIEKVADVENLTLVGYAPYDNPEIAFSVIVPNVGLDAGESVSNVIGERILDAYFQLKKERQQHGLTTANTTE